MKFAAADLVDHYQRPIFSCAAQFVQCGVRARFFGPVRTVQTLDDNVLIQGRLSTHGKRVAFKF